MKTIYFISGHLDIIWIEFLEHYKPFIDKALEENAGFVIGDARGIDFITQYYLTGKTENVTVYHMFDSPRNSIGFKTKGGFKTDKERDEAMTADSTADIAWVRPGREKCGTAKNLKRRNDLIENKIQSFRDLPDGWDFGYGKAPSQFVIDIAIEIYRFGKNLGLNTEVFPIVDGSLEISLYMRDHFMDCLIQENGQIEFSYEIGIGEKYETILQIENISLIKIKEYLIELPELSRKK